MAAHVFFVTAAMKMDAIDEPLGSSIRLFPFRSMGCFQGDIEAYAYSSLMGGTNEKERDAAHRKEEEEYAGL